MPRQYSPQLRQRALRLLEETTMEASEVSEFEAIKSVAGKLGISEESLRRWRRKAQIDAGERPGMTSSEHAEVKRLKRENAELRRANEILKAASAFFAAEYRPPPRDEMIAFIDSHCDQFGVELICRVLRAAIPAFFTSRGYRAARTRAPSDREIRDEQLIADLRTVPCAELLGLRGQEDARGDDTARLETRPRTNTAVNT